eukprot:6080630-Ditylum_brightwellii.AAC.1
MTSDAMQLIYKDIQYQVEEGFCEVHQWEDLKQKWPENLKIPPIVVVPQTGRLGRIILDLLFPVFHHSNGKRQQAQQKALQPPANDTA